MGILNWFGQSDAEKKKQLEQQQKDEYDACTKYGTIYEGSFFVGTFDEYKTMCAAFAAANGSDAKRPPYYPYLTEADKKTAWDAKVAADWRALLAAEGYTGTPEQWQKKENKQNKKDSSAEAKKQAKDTTAIKKRHRTAMTAQKADMQKIAKEKWLHEHNMQDDAAGNAAYRKHLRETAQPSAAKAAKTAAAADTDAATREAQMKTIKQADFEAEF